MKFAKPGAVRPPAPKNGPKKASKMKAPLKNARRAKIAELRAAHQKGTA